MCWPLCSHSDGWWLYAWRANRYTLYLPCGTWWMASYDDAIRQHVGFYCSFNGISVQMFIESQMLQQFENIRLCKKNSLPLVLTSSLQYQCWWEGVFRVITPICSEENCSSYLHCGDEHKRTWLRDDVIGSTRSDQYWDLNASLNRGKKTDITWRDATNLWLSLHHHFTRDFMKNTLVHPAKNLIGI